MKYLLAFIENHLNQQKVDIMRISNWPGKSESTNTTILMESQDQETWHELHCYIIKLSHHPSYHHPICVCSFEGGFTEGKGTGHGPLRVIVH